MAKRYNRVHIVSTPDKQRTFMIFLKECNRDEGIKTIIPTHLVSFFVTESDLYGETKLSRVLDRKKI